MVEKAEIGLWRSFSALSRLHTAPLAAFQSLCTKVIFENPNLIMLHTNSHRSTQPGMAQPPCTSPVSSLTLRSGYLDSVPSVPLTVFALLFCLPPAVSAPLLCLIWTAAQLLPPQGSLRQPYGPAPFPVFYCLLLSTWHLFCHPTISSIRVGRGSLLLLSFLLACISSA